ncbi:MAG: site-specific DNA-methyltransferase [Deltaproteobacteria bacterium]|nr:site-specific DNA-methyltransferase [Deltaproteobacteria bacterium]
MRPVFVIIDRMSKKNPCTLHYAGKETEASVMASTPSAPLRLVKTHGAPSDWTNMLIAGDNLGVLKTLIAGKEAGRVVNADGTPGVRLVYIDPPFSTRLVYRGTDGRHAYDDRRRGAEFVEFLRHRLILLREVMSADASIYAHLDWKTSHYVKVVMDEVFGPDNFLNEIVWSYGGRGAKAASAQFPRNHDAILLYARRPRVFNKQRREVSLPKDSPCIQQDAYGRWFKTAPRGDYTDASIASLEEAGRVHRTRSGRLRVKYFLREAEGRVIEEKLIGDVWDDVPDAMHIKASEKTGYPTQKPVALLERVIKASSNPGDLVLDAFCGSGTTLAAASALDRRWIGIDIGSLAIKTAQKRIKAGMKSNGTPGFAVYRAGKQT